METVEMCEKDFFLPLPSFAHLLEVHFILSAEKAGSNT